MSAKHSFCKGCQRWNHEEAEEKHDEKYIADFLAERKEKQNRATRFPEPIESIRGAL